MTTKGFQLALAASFSFFSLSVFSIMSRMRASLSLGMATLASQLRTVLGDTKHSAAKSLREMFCCFSQALICTLSSS